MLSWVRIFVIGALHYTTLQYRHFKRHLHLKWPVVHQQLPVIRNTAHRPSTQTSYTASRVRPKRKISCAAAQIAATQIAATLTISCTLECMNLTPIPLASWHQFMLHGEQGHLSVCSLSGAISQRVGLSRDSRLESGTFWLRARAFNHSAIEPPHLILSCSSSLCFNFQSSSPVQGVPTTCRRSQIHND